MPPAKELYGILIPAEMQNDLKQANAKVLLYSLDGILRYIPMAARHDGKKLWSVADESSSRPMENYYRIWTGTALRRAQLSIMGAAPATGLAAGAQRRLVHPKPEAGTRNYSHPL